MQRRKVFRGIIKLRYLVDWHQRQVYVWSVLEIVPLLLMWLVHYAFLFVLQPCMTYGERKSNKQNFLSFPVSLSRHSQFNPVRHSFRCEGNVALYVNEENAQGSKRSARRDRNRNKSNLHTYINQLFLPLPGGDISHSDLSQDHPIKM